MVLKTYKECYSHCNHHPYSEKVGKLVLDLNYETGKKNQVVPKVVIGSLVQEIMFARSKARLGVEMTVRCFLQSIQNYYTRVFSAAQDFSSMQ